MIQTPESVVDGGGKTTNEAEATENAKRSSYDILLNNFQIKKKRYRVLLNYDHIVWERWSPEHAKSKQKEKKIKNQKIETEQLSNTVMTNYGSNANIVHLNEIIRVCKGNTKSATLRVDDDSLSPPSDLYIPSSPSPSPSTHHPSNTTTTTAITPLAQYLTIHYAERIVKSPIDCNRWHIRCLTLYNTDPYIIEQWFTLLNRKLHENPKRLHIRRLLVFINPYGGRKKGLQTYEIYCKPLFQLAGIDASCVISQRSNQIRDILLTHDLTPYDAICCVGGDGTAAEVINGLIFRAMLDSGMNIQKPPLASYIPKPSIPIGIIPAGSTDTIAYSVHGTSDAQTAAIHLILGQRRGCDICSVRNRQGGVVRFCASVFSYGYLGDVAAKSERYRWMGPKRYEYTGVKAFLTNRGYEAEIRLLVEPPPNSYDEAASAAQFETDKNSDTVCYANCQRCNSVVLSSNSDPDADADADEEDSVDYAKPGESNLVGSNPTCEKISNFQDIPGEHSTNVLPTHSDSSTAEDVEKGKGEEVHVKNCDNNDLLTSGGDIIKCDNPICEEEMPIKQALQPPPPPTTTDERSNKSFSFCSINPTINGDNEIGSNRISGNFTLMPNQPKWKTIRGHFFMISCANITCACSRSPNGISRYNHLGDGQLDVILVRKTSIFNNLRFALNTMGRNGDVRNLPFVETYRTRQMHFHVDSSTVQNTDNLRASTQPIFLDSRTDKLVSSWNCDGEIVHDLDVTVTSHCQLIDVFMRGPYSYTEKNTKRVCCC